ncbi:MAG: tRNA pseudouridine(38-40) synthase TruA [Actinomycetota bacterium]|nr:tRNA pseudouridine(38-40) synthase TruA [Actinomycetota bacterium]
MGEVVRLRIDLAYDGTDFSGWAAQPGRRTVEGELSTGLTTVLRSEDPVRVTVAGRTDAGVHARGQVTHTDVDADLLAMAAGRSDRSAEEALGARLSGVLPADIVVRRVDRAPPGFDARFSATSRRYLYRVADDLSLRDPLRRHDTVSIRGRLDVAAMNEAAYQLLGLADFAAFCKRREGATTVRTLLAFAFTRLADGVVAGTVVADAFCHSMVRSLVGAVLPVGQGRRDPDWPADVLRAVRRDPGVLVMPARGLSLEEVDYPADCELAARAEQSRRVRGGVAGGR